MSCPKTVYAQVSIGFLRLGMPQSSTVTVSKAKGIHALATRPGERSAALAAWLGEISAPAISEKASAAALSFSPSSGNRHTSRGCQTFSRITPASKLPTAEAMSTRSTPIQFDQTNWTPANVPPMTSNAGQTARVCRQDTIVLTSQKGMISDMNGKIRPDVALRASTSSDVTPARVLIGVPMAPHATGAVLAIRHNKCRLKRPEAGRPTRKAAGDGHGGTGRPAAPTRRTPRKEKATSDRLEAA